jgi:microcystin-dependent protein
MSFFQWSRTPATNATADSGINLRDNQAPSVVKTNNRQMMAELAEWRDDNAGLLATGGTSSAYTLTTYGVFTGLTDGITVAFVPHATNAAGATLAVDGLTAKPLRLLTGTSIPAGVLVLGTPYCAVYNLSADEWRVVGYVPEPAAIPIGAGLEYWGSTAPSTNFAFPYGQAISRTTYATCFARFSTTYGSGDGSTTFNLPNVAGRIPIPKDNMSGSAAGRITTAGGGIDGSTLGATGGQQNRTIARVNLPDYTLPNTLLLTGSETDLVRTQSVNPGVAPTGGGQSIVNSVSFNETDLDIGGAVTLGGSGTALATLPPGIICNYIIRIL